MNDTCTIQYLSNGMWYDYMTMQYDSYVVRQQMESCQRMMNNGCRVRCVDSRGRLMDTL